MKPSSAMNTNCAKVTMLPHPGNSLQNKATDETFISVELSCIDSELEKMIDYTCLFQSITSLSFLSCQNLIHLLLYMLFCLLNKSLTWIFKSFLSHSDLFHRYRLFNFTLTPHFLLSLVYHCICTVGLLDVTTHYTEFWFLHSKIISVRFLPK